MLDQSSAYAFTVRFQWQEGTFISATHTVESHLRPLVKVRSYSAALQQAERILKN
jgi:hypothetical protein